MGTINTELKAEIDSFDLEFLIKRINDLQHVADPHSFCGNSELGMLHRLFALEDGALVSSLRGAMKHQANDITEYPLSRDQYSNLIDNTTYSLHKGLRQMDNYSNGNLDMLVWHSFHLMDINKWLKKIFTNKISHT